MNHPAASYGVSDPSFFLQNAASSGVLDPRRNKAALLLERAFQISDYAISGNNLLRLYEKIDLRADINSAFVKEGITVASVNVDSGKLEDYFTELVGGEGIG
ncbi:MAG: hypothetical protein HFI99_14770 [Lachnospiraceae bacterium]|jgi:bacitracin transport system ATP-binding protein|nr:hypothetical protein [Lachnospiraceae bacterium]